MSDPVVGVFLGVGLLAPCVIAGVAFTFALDNARKVDSVSSPQEAQRLTPMQALFVGSLWLLAVGGLMAAAFAGNTHFGEPREFLEGYLMAGGVSVVASGALLAHAMVNFHTLK